MGKNRHARTKPNKKIFVEKIKKNESRVKNEKKDDDSCGLQEKKEKKKKGPWYKLMRLMRRLCSSKKPGFAGGAVCSSVNLNNSSKLKIESNISKLNVVQIPLESGQKISQILIKPTENGVQAVIAKYAATSAPTLQARTEPPESKEASPLDSERNSSKNKELDTRRISDTKTVKKEGEDNNKSENLLTSALFVRKDMDKIMESAVFMEPSLSRDCMESIKSDNLSQRSIQMNKRSVRYRIMSDGYDQPKKTFKTVSEPTWDKKEKIFQQQRLQENLNELFEQLIILEKDDLLDFSVSKSKIIKEKKRIKLAEGSASLKSEEIGKESSPKELSREVSPEILVNIKPFKEYLSGTCIGLEGPFESISRQSNNVLCVKQEKISISGKDGMKNQINKNKHEKKSKSIKEKKENYDPKYHCPVIRSKIHFSGKEIERKPENEKIEKKEKEELIQQEAFDEMSCYVLDYGLQPPAHVETSSHFLVNASCTRLQTNHLPEICTVWGVYKSYNEPESFFPSRDSFTKNHNLDEVLNSLDDKDHDLIFKKNMTQFRKKLNKNPRYDNKKPSSRLEMSEIIKFGKKNVEVFDAIRKKATMTLSGQSPCIAKIAKHPENSAITKTIRELSQPQKILQNLFFMLFERNLICKALGSRIESAIMSIAQNPRIFRELYNLTGRNGFIAVQEPISEKFYNFSVKFEPGSSCLPVAGYDYNSMNGFDDVTKHVTKYFGVSERFEKSNDLEISTITDFVKPQYFSNPMECFYMLENDLYSSFEKQILGNAKKSHKNYLDDVKTVNSGTWNDDIDKSSMPSDVSKKSSHIRSEWIFWNLSFEKGHQAALILNDSPYEFVVRTQICQHPAEKNLKNPTKNFSDSFVIGTKESTSVPVPIFHSEVFIAKPGFSGVKVLEPKNKPVSSLNIFGPSATKIFLANKFEVDLNLDKRHPTCGVRSIENFKENTETNLGKKWQSTSLAELDGFQILYDGIAKESLKNENSSEGGIFTGKSSTNSMILAFGKKESQFLEVSVPGKTNIFEEQEDDKLDGGKTDDESKIKFSLSGEKKLMTKLLKFKSNSSPRENIIQTECGPQEHRLRRSLNFFKDADKLDLHNFKKKRISLDKGLDIRRTGSALTESRNPKLLKERSLANQMPDAENVALENKFRNQKELKSFVEIEAERVPDSDNSHLSLTKILVDEKNKSLKEMSEKRLEENRDKKKIFILEKNGGSVKKEVLAAFNSIKELSPSKDEAALGGNKRMSVVIMLSKK